MVGYTGAGRQSTEVERKGGESEGKAETDLGDDFKEMLTEY